MDYTQRRARRLTNLKRRMVMNWIAGFTVVAVVAVASAFSPVATVNAKFLEVETVGDDLYYRAYVEDGTGNAGDASLRIVARDQFGDRIHEAEPGANAGVFTSLKANTQYKVLIEINEGFGWRVLTKYVIQTGSGPGGRIVDYAIAPDESIHGESWRYSVMIHVIDPEAEYIAVTFRYNYLYDWENISPDTEPPTDRWISVPVDVGDVTIPLTELWKEALTWEWILEAQTASGDTVVLDQRRVATPPILSASLYVSDAGVDYLDVSVYVAAPTDLVVEYTIRLCSEAGETLEEKAFVPALESQGYYAESDPIRFNRLHKATLYYVYLIARYHDPTVDADVAPAIQTALAMTMPDFAQSVDVTETADTFLIDIVFTDPANVIHNLQYYVYRIENGMNVYVASGSASFIATAGGIKTATLEIAKPAEPYVIILSVEKRPAETIIYYACPFVRITRGSD